MKMAPIRSQKNKVRFSIFTFPILEVSGTSRDCPEGVYACNTSWESSVPGSASRTGGTQHNADHQLGCLYLLGRGASRVFSGSSRPYIANPNCFNLSHPSTCQTEFGPLLRYLRCRNVLFLPSTPSGLICRINALIKSSGISVWCFILMRYSSFVYPKLMPPNNISRIHAQTCWTSTGGQVLTVCSSLTGSRKGLTGSRKGYDDDGRDERGNGYVPMTRVKQVW